MLIPFRKTKQVPVRISSGFGTSLSLHVVQSKLDRHRAERQYWLTDLQRKAEFTERRVKDQLEQAGLLAVINQLKAELAIKQQIAQSKVDRLTGKIELLEELMRAQR